MLKFFLKNIKKLTNNLNDFVPRIFKDTKKVNILIQQQIRINKALKTPKIVPDKNLHKITNLSNEVEFKSILKSILIPRIVGTDGHFKVQNYIINSMLDLNWKVECDNFAAKTPTMGLLKFKNIIAIQNPNAKKYLVLGAHYDSKFILNMNFLGATDSAVPCAMLINLVKTLKKYLEKYYSDLSLMLIFFDGEESFSDWSLNDSLYGSRHLTVKWHQTGFLKKINMLILLDLIGAKNPKFYSFYTQTENEYLKLLNLENQLNQMGLREKNSSDNDKYFQAISAESYIEDDHTPFLNYGVPVMHLIPVPFPNCWHTEHDNMNILHFKTIENLNNILRAYVVNYLEENRFVKFNLEN